MIRNLDPGSRRRVTPSPHQAARTALKIQDHLGVHIPIAIPVSGKETWPPWDLVLPRNTGGPHWRWESNTTSSHTWQVPIVEDMVPDGKAGLTEAIVTSPGWAILFYRWQSLGEGLSFCEVWDTAFTLSGAICWVGKWAQLSAKPASLSDGQRLIAQAITEGHIKPRGTGHPHSIPPASIPFNFCNQDLSPWPAKCQ